ncbi:MAG: aspartyl protease family protein [Proteobacteria bacterium]|nr:aspartyl protease family protein [Pseudomonadota bacterium]
MSISNEIAGSPDRYFAGNAKETTLPIQIINNHIYGQAMVDGKGPFTFIFDMGGHNLLTPATAKLLGLTTEGKMAAGGAGEGTMEAGFTKVKKIEVGGAAVTDQVFTVLPLDAFANIEGTEMPGMIGFELFRRFVTRIDYGAKTLTLIDPKSFDPKGAGTPIKFTFNNHIPEVMGTFEGFPAKYDVDTGSRSELTLTKSFADKNDLKAKHPKGVDAMEGWGVGGPSRAYVTRGTEMTIGPIKIDGVVTSLSMQKKRAFYGESYQGNIGGGILKRFVVTFDYEHQTMYLKSLPRLVADIGTFDRSGMWLNKVGAGFQIADVILKGPAELAGLKADDVISAVDGKLAPSIALYDLRKRLRNDPPGTKVTFTIKRGNKTRGVVVTLKDQI